MPNDLMRPDDLPDFRKPPLNEVVVGVQFAPPTKYQQIYAAQVWELFSSEYPKVEEHSSLPPTFETFGLPSRHLNLNFGPVHNRYWFLRPDGEELIQFQRDRLLHNWRKVGDEKNVYPRFESMLQRFQDEIERFQNYVNTLSPQTLAINQCEVSYINHIEPCPDTDLNVSDWIRFLQFNRQNDPDNFSITLNDEIRNSSGEPFARLICEATSGVKVNRQKIIQLTLTVRGSPEGSDLRSALEFLSKGRERIVRKFAESTTEAAHKQWERTQ